VRTIVTVLIGIYLLTGQAAAQENYAVSRIQFEGNETFTSKTLREQIVMYAHVKLARLILGKQPYPFNNEVFRRDNNRLKAFYQSEGFLHVKVQPQLNTDDKEKKVEIVYKIEEGAPVLVQHIDFDIASGEANATAIKNIVDKITPNLSLQTGKRFRDKALKADEELLLDRLAEKSFSYAEITVDLELSTDQNRIRLTYNIVPGPGCYFGKIQITGHRYTPSQKVIRQLAFKEGTRYAPSLMQKSQQRVYQLGVFRYVTVRVAFSETKEDTLPVEIVLREVPRLTTKIGVGYGKEDKFRVFLNLGRPWFLGDARRIELDAKHSGLEPYNINVKLTQPGFLHPGGNAIINPFMRREKEPGFTVDRAGGTVTLQRQFTPSLESYVNYTLEQDNLRISKLTREQGLQNLDISIYNKSSLTLGIALDTSVPPFSPDRGVYTGFTVTYSGVGFRNDFTYARTLIDARKYKKLFGKWVVAGRLKLGAMFPTGSSEVTPIEERFYSGGSNSVRGWARSQLGPKSDAGVPIGGNSLLENSWELRFPLWKIFSGVTFLDVGNAWKSQFTYKFADLKYAAGTGLRISTPIGPIRLDVARPLFEKNLPWQFHLSVGQSF
jgi:outer membrane protein insertion porin family